MNRNQKVTTKIINAIIVAMIIAHPLLMRLYEYNTNLDNYPWMSSESGIVDIFLHCKMIFFIFCSAILTFLFVSYIYNAKTKIYLSKSTILLCFYIVLATASTLLSGYNQFSFSGIYEQFESYWCLLGYVIVVIVLYIVVSRSDQYVIYTKAFLIGAFCIGIVGLSQYIGYDLNMTTVVKHLFVPAGYSSEIQSAVSRGRVYATLYNPDYVGLYVALLIPILLTAFRILNHYAWRALAITDIILLAVCAVGANVSSGMIGVCVSVMFYIIGNAKRLFANKKRCILSLGLIVLAIVGVWGLMRFSSYLNENIFSKISGSATNESDASAEQLADLSTDHLTALNRVTETDEYVEFDYNGNIFRESISIKDGIAIIEFADEKGNALDVNYDEATQYYTLNDKHYNGISSVTCNIENTYIGMITTIDGKDWTFAYGMGPENKVSYFYYNGYGKIDKNIDSESFIIPENQWGLFNGRGFIWAKTLAIIKHHLLLGTGADSFTLVFPHNDYLAMYKAGYENMIVSKPHNLYMQCATQTGMLSLICLMAFYLIYFVKNCIRIIREETAKDEKTLLKNAFWASTIGFLVCSLANDSTICVTPIFCIIMGLALSLDK